MRDGLIAIVPKNGREHVRVRLTAFNDHDLVDLRVFSLEGGEAKPTRSGVCVNVSTLPELRAALDKAEREARRLGLLEDVTPRRHP